MSRGQCGDLGQVVRVDPSPDRGTVPVQQLVDQNAHSLITTDPTAWFFALKVGPHGFRRPGHRAHQKVVAAQRLHAECSAHAQVRQWAGRDTAVARRDHPSWRSQLRSELTSGQGGTALELAGPLRRQGASTVAVVGPHTLPAPVAVCVTTVAGEGTIWVDNNGECGTTGPVRSDPV